ncbi:MAG: S8 family serine peptidase [Candidatus Kapaibacterium sp.]
MDISPNLVKKVDQKYYEQNRIHIKLKGKKHIVNKKALSESILNSYLSKLNVVSIKAPYERYESNILLSSSTASSLSRIYEVVYDSPVDPYDACIELETNPEVEYADPIFIRYTNEYIPNDPRLKDQWHINALNLPEAWEITKGSKDVIIAITDSGVEWDHEDLADNIWVNEDEIPGDGIDNDNNGKVDDIRGWDFVGNYTGGSFREDNDPKPTSTHVSHGTHVAGCAAAITDNGKGIASPAFNCTIMPLKLSSDNPQYGGIYRGYDAILYAAENGADIINCSWGGSGGSRAEQDIINAAFEMGAVVIAAAGNDGVSLEDSPHYPSSYANLATIGGTRSNRRNSFNYGYSVTAYSPGVGINSTYPDNSYKSESGTSMASPVAAGIAALIKSIHPDWTPRQIIQQLRSCTNELAGVSDEQKPQFYGIADALKAVTLNNPINGANAVPGVYAYETAFNGEHFNTIGEVKKFTAKIKNYLSDAKNLVVTATPVQDYLTIDVSDFIIGDLLNDDEASIELNATLGSNTPWYDGYADILLKYEADGYLDYQLVRLSINLKTDNKFGTNYSFRDSPSISWSTASAFDMNGLLIGGFLRFSSTNRGVYIRTTGGGANVQALAEDPIYSSHAFNSSRQYFGTETRREQAKIFYTYNGGSTWNNVEVGNITGFINDIYFFDENNGIFLGDPQNGKWGVGKTQNGGQGWSALENLPEPLQDEAGYVNACYFSDDKIWFGTNKGRIIFSSNRGNTWQVKTISENKHIRDIAFYDLQNGMAIISEGIETDGSEPKYIARTTNGGNSWEVDSENINGKMYPVYLYGPDNSRSLIMLDERGHVWITTDLGRTWSFELTRDIPGNYTIGADDGNDNTSRLWQIGKYLTYIEFYSVPYNVNNEISLLTAEEVDLDTLEINKFKFDIVRLKNNGNIDINVTDVKLVVPSFVEEDEFTITSPFQNPIQPGLQSSLTLKYSPKKEGPKEAILEITTDGDPQKIDIHYSAYAKEPLSVVSAAGPGNGFEISPNPSDSKCALKLELSNPGRYELNLYDSKGSVAVKQTHMFNKGLNKRDLDISALAAGTYHIVISNGENYFTGKVIKR